MNRKIKPEDYHKVVARYNENVPASQIAKEYNVDGKTITTILKKFGVKIDPYKFRKYTLNQSFFEKIDTEEKAYWLGFLYADGNNNLDGGIAFQLQELDIEILEKFKVSLEFTGKITLVPKKKDHHQNQFRVDINSVQMSKDLIKLGCVPNKSSILDFPTEDQVPENLLRHFLRGYFDGDGGITWIENKIKSSFTASPFFIERLQKYLINLFGFHFPIQAYKNTTSQTLTLNGTRQNIVFLDWLYSDCSFFLQRKRGKFFNFLKYYISKYKNKNSQSKININPFIEKYKKVLSFP